MANIKFMAMGGLGQNGMNMYLVEVNERIFILDAGIKYPDMDMYGVDAVVPSIDYLIERKDQIEGIFVSHSHEDNMGAVPYILQNLHTRVYGSHFTISLIEARLKENNMKIKDFKLFRINANKVMKFNDVKVSFFNTTHSVPESMGICLSTEDGNIIYCTDFNFGSFYEGTYQTTFDKIVELSKTKVLALLTESISSGNVNRISNDSLLEHKFNGILSRNIDRIIVGCHATDIIRIQKVIDLSVKVGRMVAVVTKRGAKLIDTALETGYLKIPKENFIDIKNISKEELSSLTNVVIVVCGFRNEPYQALIKMASKEDDLLEIKEEDVLVLICPPFSGMEKLANDTINTLCELGVNLVNFDKKIIRSAHASPEDLKMLYSIVKPNYIIPIKGEYRHMYEQSLVAKESGFDRDHIILLDNGEQISFNKGILEEDHNFYNIKEMFIDGTSIGVVDNDVLVERTTLAEEGIIFVYASVDLRKKQLVGKVSLSTKGFSHSIKEEDLTNSLGDLMERIINNYFKKKRWDKPSVEENLKTELSKIVFRYTKHRPIIVPVILEIE